MQNTMTGSQPACEHVPAGLQLGLGLELVDWPSLSKLLLALICEEEQVLLVVAVLGRLGVPFAAMHPKPLGWALAFQKVESPQPRTEEHPVPVASPFDSEHQWVACLAH